jgi:hypothetical protein
MDAPIVSFEANADSAGMLISNVRGPAFRTVMSDPRGRARFPTGWLAGRGLEDDVASVIVNLGPRLEILPR